MYYQTENEDLSLNEFIRKHQLPCLAMVKQGYYGDTVYNILDAEQVLRIHGVYSDHRIYGEVLNDSNMCFGRDAVVVSVPLTCNIPMNVIKKGKIEKVTKSLRSVLANHKLPVDVQLETPGNSFCMVNSGNQRKAITGKVHLRLYEHHSLQYIYGNPVCKDKLYGNIFSILVNDCDAKLALITGLTNDNHYFSSLVQGMAATVETYLTFENNIGHRDIFVAMRTKLKHHNNPSSQIEDHLSAAHTYETPNPVYFGKDGHVYSELKPGTIRPAAGFRSRISLQYLDKEPSNAAYISRHNLSPQNTNFKYIFQKQLPVDKKETGENAHFSDRNSCQYTTYRYSEAITKRPQSFGGVDQVSRSPSRRRENDRMNNHQLRNPDELTSPLRENNYQPSRSGSYEQYPSKARPRENVHTSGNSNQPPLPPRVKKSVDNVQANCTSNYGQRESESCGNVQTKRKKFSDLYLPTQFYSGENAHVIRSRHEEVTLSIGECQSATVNTSNSNNQGPMSRKYNTNLRKVSSPSDVKTLTIEELGQYLEYLNLGRHVKNFAKDQIDGCLLQELDEQFLQDEFGLSRFEALKLTKFSKKGYLPKT